MSILIHLLVSLALGAATLARTAEATTFETLYYFTGKADGGEPLAGVVFRNGLLYGTTSSGGAARAGTVFQLDPATRTLTTLHHFAPKNGKAPFGAVVFDKAGVLYGTTITGGAANAGTVFQLDPATRTLTTLHHFAGEDGKAPWGELVFDESGLLYGTTASGGRANAGTVFQLDPATRTLTTLHRFKGKADGEIPLAGLVFRNGLLYGTAGLGGRYGFGTVFQLDPVTRTLATLHRFNGKADGGYPRSAVVFDKTGLLYGTTMSGGPANAGTVFRLDPVTRTLTTLHRFKGKADGKDPRANVVFDTAGVLYGTTYNGGDAAHPHAGTAFQLDPATRTLTTLHYFAGEDGKAPIGQVVFDTAGVLYGTTFRGGPANAGTVFKLIP